ncbi:ABC transporter substrate-binding protein [Rhizobium beringeri]
MQRALGRYFLSLAISEWDYVSFSTLMLTKLIRPHNVSLMPKGTREISGGEQDEFLERIPPTGCGRGAAGAALVAMGLCWTVPAFADDVIRVVSPYQTTTLDPMRSAAAGNIETYGQLYSRLLRRNSETGALEPGLAEKWEISPEGKSYTFHLRDAQFSDGSPITAADVAFSLNRIRATRGRLILRRWGPWNL